MLGKFLGALGLVATALALTLPLPLTVAWLGPLDWGPVLGGYVAALALACTYAAIGLWVSSRTDNQFVSLILTVVIAGAFYLVGTAPLTSLFGHRVGDDRVLKSSSAPWHQKVKSWNARPLLDAAARDRLLVADSASSKASSSTAARHR